MTPTPAVDRSRIPDFYKLSVSDRARLMHERGWVSEQDYEAMVSGAHTLKLHRADKMIENVVGVMGLPVGLGLNFLIDGRDYVVPLVVEEPSIVAALSSAAKLARTGGGFTTSCTESLLIGQVQVVDLPDIAQARETLITRKDELLNLANSLHPQMVARGGGAIEVEVHRHALPGREMLALHLLVDTCDAMGANLVNTMCEGIATLVEALTGGKVFLRILSNLTDRALVRARCVIPVNALRSRRFSGEQVRDGVILANDFALVDPYRAATHNKGVMNGVDAVALATGNDWRAIEAAAHAYAARSGRYTALTRWSADAQGALVGEIEIPMKVGTVGGPLQSNPTVALNHRLLGIGSARELASVMAAVGLAQNFSALRALATDGIQQGHMTLHARSCAMAAGAGAERFETVVERLIESGEIKIWKAREILAALDQDAGASPAAAPVPDRSQGHGKIILFGEHAVVYGSHAIAAPVPLAIEASVRPGEAEGVTLLIPRWGVETRLDTDPAHRNALQRSLGLILDRLELRSQRLLIEVFPKLPRAMGLGGSSAMAVAVIRALDRHFRIGLTDEGVNRLAYACEEVAHGTPSGIDNTVATYGRPLLYRRAIGGEPALMQPLQLVRPLPLVIGMTRKESLTAKTVGAVRAAWQNHPVLYEGLFRQIDQITLQGLAAAQADQLEQLGELMNVCHGLLNALRVSSPELEDLVEIARRNGALGAKLTGGGGGGSMIALCPDHAQQVMSAMRDAGYQAMEVQIG